MDRFKLDDMEDEFDTVEPMRASSFDMSFTLSNSRVATAADDDDDGDSHHHNSNRSNRSNHGSSDSGENDGDERWTTTNWRAAHRTMLDDPSNHNTSGATDDQSSLHVSQRRKRSSPHEQQSALDTEASDKSSTIAQKLEEKAHETIALASLCGKVPWRLAKRNQDVHIYRPASLPESEQSKLYFRISCEVKANLHTILEYLTPRDTKSYVDIEAQVFPGLLHASVIKRMELPEHSSSASTALPEPLYKDTTSTDDASSTTATGAIGSSGSGTDTFPRLQVKWHASRFAGRFVKPVDFFFVEYANIDTLADGRKRGFGYVRSVESFKGDELATRLHSDDVAIPPSVAKCKRAVINKGVYLVSPSGDAPGTYDVTFMLVIDFQQQFPSSVGAKIVQSFTDRLMGIRELLFNTLFQPVSLVPKESWKPARGNKCAVCYATFSFVKPMHHCRACGEAVCGQCSRKWVVQPGQQQKETLKRLCTSCSLQARSYLMGGEAIAPTHLSPAAADNSRRTLSRSADPTLRMTSSSASARPSARMLVHEPMPMCDVKIASAVSTDVNHFNAVSTAFSSLCESLGGVVPHFMMVAYSKEYDGYAVYEALAHCAPDTLFMGGTSSAGVFSERGSVSKGPGLALWGIYDPEGSYSVLNADLAVENPRDAARRCVLESIAMLCMEPEESPDFVWMSVRTGSEELLVKGVNDAVDCAVAVVGGSSTRNHIGASTIPATQICSEGSTVGCVTTHGACFAICSPSVEVSQALFTCYEPKDKVLGVTKAAGRELAALGHKPAFSALNDACHGMLYEFLNRPERFNAETHTLPLFYPVARERPAPKPPLLTSKLPTYQHHVLQPEHAGKDLVLHLGADVQLGDRLRVMAIEPERVKEKISGGYREALRATQPALDASDVIGCLTSVGLCYTKIVQGKLKCVSEATSRMFPNAAVLGSVSHGQQGVFHGASTAIHANGMVSSLLLTNRKKVQRGAALPPLGLRRISTF